MPIGITNTTVINMSDISYIANSSTPAHLFVNINEIVFDGYAFFLILCAAWVILFIVLQKTGEDYPFHNAMYSGGAISFASFFIRAVEVYVHGTKVGLLTDKLLWVFPMITLAIAWGLWMTKDT